MQLRFFQQDLENRTFKAWQQHRNVLTVLPTGGGKTALFSSIMGKWSGYRIAIAHRQELVGQMSLSLAKWGMRHRIVAAEATVREIIRLHQNELGRSYYDPSSTVICAGVDTLIRRQEPWFSRVSLWVMDEAHHVLTTNKWGEAVKLFPAAYGLGVTATPIRADGKGLGADSDGVFHHMEVGPTGRELMNEGWLSDYEVYCFKPGDLRFDDVELGSTGDYKLPQLRKATHASAQLVGDVVSTYQRFGTGKRGITFAVDIEDARRLTQAYIQAGVPAQLVTAQTPLLDRSHILRKFRAGELLQLVNVDLFGEGFDVPGVEIVSMARKTNSYSLFSQQLGRMLRPVFAKGVDLSAAEGRKAAIAAGGKPRGILLDHVGNYVAHATRMGLPEDSKPWTLAARERNKRAANDGTPLSSCTECGRPYERYRPRCPYCGFEPVVAERSKPEQVDGDLELLDKSALAAIVNEVNRIDAPPQVPQHLLGTPAAVAIHNAHKARAVAQQELRETISKWGGWQTHAGLDIREAQRRFYHTFGVDVLTAQTLSTKEANELKERVINNLGDTK